jgi:hypothetical protein
MNAQGTTMANNAVHVEQERYLFMSFLKGAQTVRRPAQIPRTAIIFKMTIGDQPSQDQPMYYCYVPRRRANYRTVHYGGMTDIISQTSHFTYCKQVTK